MNSIILVAALWVAYRLCVALYNISPFHPLHKFPGPRIAAASYWYEAWYDWLRGGRYGREIKRMHDKYGPIVRINPDELHCNDPSFMDEIYTTNVSRPRDKWQHQINTGGAGPVAVSAFSTIPHAEHRAKRAPFGKFFSRASILRLEGDINDLVQRTVDKMLSKKGGGKAAFNVKDAFNCFTADTISQFAFGETMGFVDQEGWEPNFATWVHSFLKSAYMMRHNVVARKLVAFAPVLADYMGEDMKLVFRQMMVTIPGHIQTALKDKNNRHLFGELAKAKVLTDDENVKWWISGEGFGFLSCGMAGTETTGATLTCLTFHLLSKPELYKRLVESLQGVDPMKPSWNELEQRPFVWACIHEALRLMPGVSQRSARIAREEDLVYRPKNSDKDTAWVIPRGTPIGMTSVINHSDETLFPNPTEFIPDRWIVKETGQPNYALEKFMMAFGRGSRNCIGINLAYCELFLMTATLALRVLPRARLVDTTIEDMTYDHDMIVLQTKKGSISCRITIS